MIDPIQQSLHDGAKALEGASRQAREWVERLAQSATSVANEEHSLGEATRQSENLARKLAASSGRRNSAGVFGPSQAGKSYLVSVLARNQRSRNPLTADFAGTLKNFIAEINPPGDRESTGLVTRFTIVPGTTDATHPVELRMLTETDLVKILGNSFLSDFDPNNRKVKLPDDDAIRSAIAALEVQAHAPQPHLDEITMFDVGEYFRTYFPTGVEAFRRAGYWDALTRFGHRLPDAARAKMYALLWGELPEFTRLFSTLDGALAKLQHAPSARAALQALTPRDDSIIDVEILKRLNTAKDADDLISVTPELPAGRDAPPAKIPRAVLTALVAEIKIVIAEQPWDFFSHTDLLDFPGARSRAKEVELPSDADEREAMVRNMLLRGKIAYLFQRYTEERELTCMLLCMPPLPAEVKDLAGMVRGWVEQTHGTSPEQRQRLACALFLVLTKFDMDFIEKEGDTAASRSNQFARRLGASFLELYGRDAWAQDWDGQPFNNTVFLRNPGLKQQHIIRYGETRKLEDGSEQRVEAGLNEEAISRLAEYRAGFLQAPDCRRHFRDMEAVWDAAFELNDGGVGYLVGRLRGVLSPTLKTRQLAGRLVEQARALDGRLRRFYQAGDDASRKEKEAELQNLRMRLYKVFNARGFRNFAQLLGRLQLVDADVRAAFLNVASLKLEPAPVADAGDAKDLPAEWDDPWGSGDSDPKAAAALSPAPGRQRDRADQFATQVLNLWTERVRGLAADTQALTALGMDAQLVIALADELVIGAHRQQLIERIAERIRSKIAAANVRWDEVADRAAGLAAMLVNDYVYYLGFGDLMVSDRPAVPEPPRQRERSVFTPPPLPPLGSIPTLGEARAPLERLYFLDWGVALRQLGLANMSFSGGREIGEEDNRALGAILEQAQPALQLKLG
jgi:hypothetical protein